jgi:hypothetical protein
MIVGNNLSFSSQFFTCVEFSFMITPVFPSNRSECAYLAMKVCGEPLAKRVAAVSGSEICSLAVDYYLTLAVFAISLDDRDHLWGVPFSFFDRGCVPVRIVTTVLACPCRHTVLYPTNTNSKANFF